MANKRISFVNIAAILSVFCIFAGAVFFYVFFAKKSFWGSVKDKARNGAEIIYFSEVTDFDWDVMCVLGPYSPDPIQNPAVVQKLIQGDMSAIQHKIPNLYDDGKWAFVFIKDGKAIEIKERGWGYYLYKNYQDNCMSKLNAILSVKGDNILIGSNQNPKFGFSLPTMLVLDLKGDGLNLTSLYSREAAHWDIDQDDFKEVSGWINYGSALLAIDINNDGVINNLSELFGSYTSKKDGFVSLSFYDSNKDGRITKEDTRFNDLLVWVDRDFNGIGTFSELYTLASVGVTSIDLNKNQVAHDIQNNKVLYEGTFVIRGKIHKIADVQFKYNNINTISSKDYRVDNRTLFLPTMRGHGIIPGLTMAMSLNANLIEKMTEIASLDPAILFSSKFDLKNKMTTVLYEWAGVMSISPQDRGPNIDARALSFIEAFTGETFLQQGKYPNPKPQAAAYLKESFSQMYNNLSAGILIQTHAENIFKERPKFHASIGIFARGKWSLDINVIHKIITEEKLNARELQLKWTEIIRFIHYAADVDKLSDEDKASLDNLIKMSDQSHSLSLALLTDLVSKKEIK